MKKKPLILGIESSCDETAVAIVTENEDGTPISGRAAFGLPPRDMFVLDIGPDTQEKFGEIIKNSTNVIWIDTVGAIQHGEGQAGTGVILEAISGILENGGVGIAAGSNLVNALRTTNGVEDETLSCGTGTTAVAIYCFNKLNMQGPIYISTMGGELIVSKEEDEIYLSGQAVSTFRGDFEI